MLKKFPIRPIITMTPRPVRLARYAVLLVVSFCQPPSSLAQVNVTTFHYDNSRSGQNIAETLLTPANVNSNQFGKLFSVTVDGYVYAQPLYLANITISGATHNVLYIGTEHDSVYAIDADNGNLLSRRSFINPTAGITTVPSSDVACNDLVPEIGITSTPVIDPATGTLYVLAKSEENGSYVQRLHALDVKTLAEKFGGPKIISATIQGRTFDPLKEANRPGLLLENNHVVIAWASHCDNGPYQGWVMAYSASTLAQEAVFNTELNTTKGNDGGIWMSGDGIAADGVGNLYFATGNGHYDGSTDFGDSIVKLTGPTNGRFSVADWFTPFNQSTLNGGDTDLGSGGVLLLPDLPAGSVHRQMLVQMGKEGKIYLIDRNNMGTFCSTCTSSDTNIVQEIPGASTGIWGSPAFWNNTVFWGGGVQSGNSDHVKAWSFNENNSGLLSNSPVSETSRSFSFSTGTPVISANQNSNGILWITDNSSFGSVCCQILYAFDASNLGQMLYRSNQAANSDDVPGGAVKFTAPVVANGKVYVGSQSTVSAFGTLVAMPVFSPKAGTYTAAQSVTITDPAAGAVIYYTIDGTTPTTASNLYSGPVIVASTQTLKAMAAAKGYGNSRVGSAAYTIIAATPVFSPKAGTYTAAQSVSMTDATAGSVIYYTTDGTTPTTASKLYSGPVTVASTQTLKAMAAAKGYRNSAVRSAAYAIVAATPVFSPKGGTFTTAQSVNITDLTAGAVIYYTTDGTTPITASSRYSGPVRVSSTQTLKAVAAASGYGNSAVGSAAYAIVAATPVFSPQAGTYTAAKSVTITDVTAGAVIYYTTDGTTPSPASNLYSGPITVSSTETLKAMAVASGYGNSAVASAAYTIVGGASLTSLPAHGPGF